MTFLPSRNYMQICWVVPDLHAAIEHWARQAGVGPFFYFDDVTYENGVYRVGKTRVMLDSVLAGFQQGHSPETIRQQYPALTLEEVYGSIAYYLGHVKEIDAYLLRQDSAWQQERLKSEQQASPVLERLRALKKAGAEVT